MSEEISLPPMSEEQKKKMQMSLQARVEKAVSFTEQRSKGKEPEHEEKPPSDLMRKLAAHAAKNAYSSAGSSMKKTGEEEEVASSPSPCLLVAAAFLGAVGIAVYFGHKYWKTYGVTPEELAS